MKSMAASVLMVAVLAGGSALLPPLGWEETRLTEAPAAIAGDRLDQRNAAHVQPGGQRPLAPPPAWRAAEGGWHGPGGEPS